MLALALLFQAVTLPADTAQASLRCAQAVALADTGDSHMRRSAQVSFFMMNAAKADPQGKPFLTRVAELAPQPNAAQKPAAGALLKLCDQRFPLARSQAAVKLPADPFERDVTCFGTIALLNGAAQQFAEDEGDEGPLNRIKPLMDTLAGKMTDELIKAHGVGTEDLFTAYMGDRLKASLAIGNPESVARACGLPSL